MEQANNITLPVNDIITPEAIIAWPPAIGWWLLLCLLTLLLVLGTIFIRRHRKFWGYRKAALNELKKVIERTDASKNITSSATEFVSIIKRVSMTIYQQQHFLTLEGSRFLSFANATLSEPAFSQVTINSIDNVLYKEHQNFDIDTFYHECCHWVKRHPEQYKELSGHMTDV